MRTLVFVGLFSFAASTEVSQGQVALRPSFLSAHREAHFGNAKCQCIGLNNVDGETVGEVKVDGEKKAVTFPADLGARCEAWDGMKNPECLKGDKKPDWCAKAWCYVDPCKCDIETLPKLASYVPDASYLNRPIYYSYATCGTTDTWATKIPEIGSYGCRCIGFKDAPGTTEVLYKGDTVVYPGDLGASCEAWDLNKNPDCIVDDPKQAPSWCAQKWCYVDPCSCNLEVPPKVSAYVADATFQGRTVFYSYATCGGKDSWTAENHAEACVNQASEAACGEKAKCSWVAGRGCIGKELAGACNAPASVVAAPALVRKSGAGRFGALSVLAAGGIVLTM